MISILMIFFVEFASIRYLAHIDEKVMHMQICEPESQHAIIQPITNFLSQQSVVIGGKKTWDRFGHRWGSCRTSY
jgi:hypothetical protein